MGRLRYAYLEYRVGRHASQNLPSSIQWCAQILFQAFECGTTMAATAHEERTIWRH